MKVVFWWLLALGLVSVTGAWAQGPYGGPMMGWGGWGAMGVVGWVMMLLMLAILVLLVVALILGIVWLSRQLRLGGTPPRPV